MKKSFKKIICAFAVMVMTAFSLVILTSCGGGLAMPTGTAVVGNGTDVVQVGKYETGVFVPEYIYYANGYKSHTELISGSDNENVKVADLVRVKLTAGKPEYDENGDVKNLEVVCSKIVGSENTAMFVVGEYIYFGSPNIHKTNQNKHQFNLVSIFRVKLDGTDMKEIYTTPEYDGGSYTVLSHNGKNYLTIYTGKKLVKFEIGKGVGSEVELAKDLTGIALPKQGDAFNGEIYFTTDRTEAQKENGQTGNLLKKVNIETGTVTERYNINGKSISLVGVYNNELIFSKEDGTFRFDVKKTTSSIETSTRMAWDALTGIYDMGTASSGAHRGYVLSYSGKLMLLKKGSMDMTEILNESISILTVCDDYIYYSSGTSIMRIACFAGKTAQKVFENSTMLTTKISVHSGYVYFFNKAANEDIEDDEENVIVYPDNYFMYRVSMAGAETGNEVKQEVLAVRKGEVKLKTSLIEPEF